MKKIILSYDYELFFGEKSGTVYNSIILPTNRLLDAMDRYGQKGNFFVDYLMLKCLLLVNTEKSLSDYALLEEQLKDIVSRGHRIELHIHPHWVNAKYNGDGTWDFSDFSHYSLDCFSQDEVTEMFKEGVALLNGIAQKVDPLYRIVAFRAGGWTVQPFSKLVDGFIQAGIKVDSSVSLGSFNKTQYFEYDFSYIRTKCKYKYFFAEDVTVEDKNGSFIEFPITSHKRNCFMKILDKLYRTLTSNSSYYSDGTHKRRDMHCYRKSTNSMLTLSWRSPLSTLFAAFGANCPIVTLIDHPKDYHTRNDRVLQLLSYCFQSVTYKELI